MIKKYILFLFVLPLITYAQTVEIESSIEPVLDAYGETSFSGLGEYEIFLDTNTGILDKPIIVVDGFDPADGRDIPGLYSLLSFTGSMGAQNLADLVRDEGFDVVILNFPQYLRLSDNSLLNIDAVTDTNGDMIIDEADFPLGSTLIDGGADYMERNAMILVDLINTLNADKVGDEELVIIGPSMGGLISRYALNYMENQALDHQTRLWISFDAPHHGANVPLGFQHQFNFLGFGLGDGLNVTQLQPIVNGLLKSPAARQLLVDHFESHLASGSEVDFDPAKLLPEAHPFKAIFDASINGLTPTGFPQNTRNVSIINGSGIGAPYQAINGDNIEPSFSALLLQDLPLPDAGPVTNITADITVKLTPFADQQDVISDISVAGFLFGFPAPLINVEVNAESPLFSNGVDAASGGLFNLGAFTNDLGTDPLVLGFIDALKIDRFNFIPSVSGMALEITANNEINWFHDIDLGDPGSTGDVLNSTPFVNWYMPDGNEDHVQLTEQNVAFALTEIMPETLSNTAFENENTLKIEKNPILNELVVLTASPIEEATILLVDITGKIVYNRDFDSLNSRTVIPLNLDSGLYVLHITTKGNLNYRTKLVVK
ncbi:T9SS type A sorting domain-containing protein [uncultured Psychroserpens sp.]|uniref:T9SS type A sorting domain-containing protein n=1 Tax=uncultured Psychroserpens sp. TaxID=255436 RepID=UPI0026297BBF|nr:T9SS type A sorting domain-containing protein [uncultured Psychroserpens sp.]